MMQKYTRPCRHICFFMGSCLVILMLSIPAHAFSPVYWSAAPSMNAARDFHSATLLPDGRVLVAGGYNGTSTLASAEFYNPADNAWSNAASMHTARKHHTATLLPDGRVLVIGGSNSSSSALAGGELYNPATDTWTDAGAMDTARKHHTATLLPNGKVLVTGGALSIASAELYNPVTGTWSNTADMKVSHMEHTATLLPDGTVLVAGGWNQTPTGTSVIDISELYDPAADKWSATKGTMTTPRYRHSATLLPDGKVLMAGGQAAAYNVLTDIYDPATGFWSNDVVMNVSRIRHTATLLPNGKILVTGGQGSAGTPDSVELYTPATGSVAANWTSTLSLAAKRFGHTATLLADGRVLVTGGLGVDYLASTEIYNPAAGGNTWSRGRTMTDARNGHRATLLPAGTVMFTGGHNTTSGSLTSVELYNPASYTLSTATSMHTARYQPSATLLPDGRVLVAGGKDNAAILASVEIYDPGGDSWAKVAAMQTARLNHSATLLPDGRVLVTGGSSSAGYLNSAELFNPATNKWTTAASMKTARNYHTATLLPNGRVLVTGGDSDSLLANFLDSAEIYDPTTNKWTDAAPMNAARKYHTATLLPSGKILVAGGRNTTPYLNSAEIYDPATDTWTTTSYLMNYGRQAHSAVLLLDGRVLVAGGGTDTGYVTTAELYDPGKHTWTPAGTLNTGRTRPTITLLPDSKVLIAGGDSLAGPAAGLENFLVGLGFINDWRPTVTSVSEPLNPGTAVLITGSGFRGTGNTEASSGGTMSSATNYPLIQIRSAGNEQVRWLTPENFTATGYSGKPITDFPGGPAWLTVFVNGIPSFAYSIVIPVKNGFPWTMFLPAITNKRSPP